MADAKIHLAPVAPAFCASCFNAQPEMRHVDFGAFYEGPTFSARDDSPVAEGMVITVDDLVICETCMVAGGAEVDLGNVSDLKRQLAERDEQLSEVSDRAAALSAHVAQLEQTIASRHTLDEKMPEPARSRTRGPKR